jgi:hypothetical protein
MTSAATRRNPDVQRFPGVGIESDGMTREFDEIR